MTLQGVLRQVVAAQRRAARNDERRQRLHARAMKLQAKVDELASAAAEVEEFEERILQLTTIHHSVGESMDWDEISARPAPLTPQKMSRWENAAVHTRDVFKLNLWQRIFGDEKKLRARLDEEIVQAKQRDEVSHEGALKLHAIQFEQWRELNQLATAILSGETISYRKAFDELEPLSEMQDFGCEFEVKFPDQFTAEINMTVESDKVMPRESKSLTRAGKLTVKETPLGKFYELYQDYVCGCVLRTARELFSFLPLKRIVVNVNATLLDTSTGHMRKQPILSVGMPRATVEGLNFVAVDPSDAMSMFPHNIGFKRSKGFFAVQPLAPSEYPRIAV